MLRTRAQWPLLILLIALVVSSLPSAGALDATGVLERVQLWLDETRDLEASFEQTLVSGAFGAGIEESGRLYLERPGRMRWDYLDPEVKVALVVDDRTWLYLAEEEQIWVGRLAATDALLPTLLAGGEPLNRIFDAALVEQPGSRGRGYRLRLAPRDHSESFQEVVLTLHPPRFELRQVEVLDPAGNRMLYRFEGIERNLGLSAAVFQFEPPPGTEVVATGAPDEDR